MKKIENIKTTTYDYDGNFFVEIVDNSNNENFTKYSEDIFDNRCYQLWLYHKSIGIKMYMYGISKDCVASIDELLNIIERDIDGYIKMYFDEKVPFNYMKMTNQNFIPKTPD